MIPKIIGAVVILAVLGGGGYYYYQNMQNKTAVEEKAVTVTEAPTPTPTPEEVDKAEFTIKILNGSGIAGEAGRAQKLLEDAEFTVDSTGNAKTYDYEETVIQAGADVSDAWIDALTEELENAYTVKASVEDLDEGADTDVVVIIGNKDEDGEKMEAAVDTNTKEDTKEVSDEANTKPTSPTTSPTPTPKKGT